MNTRPTKTNRRLYTPEDINLVRVLVKKGYCLKDAAAAIDRSVENISTKNRMLVRAGKEPMWPVDMVRSTQTQTGNKFGFRMRVPNNADKVWAQINPNFSV